MVNLWVQSIMGSPDSRVPSWFEFNLLDFTSSATPAVEGGTGREQSNALCKVCKDGKKYREKKGMS